MSYGVKVTVTVEVWNGSEDKPDFSMTDSESIGHGPERLISQYSTAENLVADRIYNLLRDRYPI